MVCGESDSYSFKYCESFFSVYAGERWDFMEIVIFGICNSEAGFLYCFRSVCVEVDVVYEFVVSYLVERIDDQIMGCVFFVKLVCVLVWLIKSDF